MDHRNHPSFRSPGAYPLPGEASHRNSAKWLAGLLLFVALGVTLIVLQLFQATAEGTSERSLRRAVAALAEIDLLLERNFDELQQRATDARPGETVSLRDFPVNVPLAAEDVDGASREEVRETLLDRSAQALYEDGTAVLRASAESRGGVATFTIAGVTDNGLGFLRERNHNVLGVALFVLAAISLVLAAMLSAACRGFGRLTGPGIVILAAGGAALLFGAAVWGYAEIVGGSEYVEREFMSIVSDLAWIPIRDGAAFVALGLLFVVAGLAGSAWTSRQAEGILYSA